jgi:predicted metalloendopeptidase
MRDVQFQFTSQVTGQIQRPSKWKECVGLVTATLAHAVGSQYVQKYFKEDARTQAIKMFQDIHNSFTSLLTEAEWMDPITK